MECEFSPTRNERCGAGAGPEVTVRGLGRDAAGAGRRPAARAQLNYLRARVEVGDGEQHGAVIAFADDVVDLLHGLDNGLDLLGALLVGADDVHDVHGPHSVARPPDGIAALQLRAHGYPISGLLSVLRPSSLP